MNSRVELVMLDATNKYLNFLETSVKIDSQNYPKNNSYEFLKNLSDLLNSGINTGILSQIEIKNAIVSRAAIQSLLEQSRSKLLLDGILNSVSSENFYNRVMTPREVFAKSIIEFRDTYFHDTIDSSGRYSSEVRLRYR